MPYQTLKKARESKGISQMALANEARVSQTDISHAELGLRPLKLHDMIRIEHLLNQRIDWKEDLSPDERIDVLQSLQTLIRRYPVQAVLQFAEKSLANNDISKLGFYAEAVQDNDPGTLLPPGVGRSSK